MSGRPSLLRRAKQPVVNFVCYQAIIFFIDCVKRYVDNVAYYNVTIGNTFTNAI